MSDPRTLLEVSHLTMRFGGLTAIDNLSLKVPANSITAIIGPNGKAFSRCRRVAVAHAA